MHCIWSAVCVAAIANVQGSCLSQWLSSRWQDCAGSRCSAVAGGAGDAELGAGIASGEMPQPQACMLYILRVGVVERLGELSQVCREHYYMSLRYMICPWQVPVANWKSALRCHIRRGCAYVSLEGRSRTALQCCFCMVYRVSCRSALILPMQLNQLALPPSIHARQILM